MSRIFPHPNLSNGWACPVCRTSADAPVMLVPVHGTEIDGIMEAKQVHADCVEVVQRMMRASTKEGAPRPAEEACPEPEGCDCNEGYGHPMSCGRCHGSGIVGGAGRKASK